MLDSINRLESEVRGYVRSFPAVFKSAKGSHLTDTSGKTYVDFFCGAGTLNYGHNNPTAKRALLDYIAEDGIQHSLDTATTAKLDFLEAFERWILKPRKLDYKVQFTGPTGTNAVEAAIKLARKQKQRSHIIAFTNAYHGHSLGSLTLTGNDYYHSEYYGSRNNVSHLPFDGYWGDADTSKLLEKMLLDSSSGIPLPAAIILETIQGEGGINVADRKWLQNVARLCRELDILLIVDDIQVGNGRTGHFFSFEDSGIVPDLVCMSKSIGGGLPMSLVLIRPECDVWSPGEHTGTFRGNNLAFVAARACLEYWRTDDLERCVQSHGEAIRDRLFQFQSRFSDRNLQVRGRGMIWGLDFGDGKISSEISSRAFEQGLLIESAGAQGEVLKVMPALTIDSETLRTGLDILETAIAEADECFGPLLPKIQGHIHSSGVTDFPSSTVS